jgi:AcrR family transcriptional regulator
VAREEPLKVWERPEPPARPAPAPLSRESIVRAAIELADRDGIGAVSLRKVGAALDAGPMRLYGYVASKEELLDLMVDQIYGEIVPDEPSGDWRVRMRAVAHGLRSAAHRHEWFVDLLGSRPHVGGPNSLAYLEAALSALGGVDGLDDIDGVMMAARSVNAYLVGAIRLEIAEARAERATGRTKEQWQGSTVDYLRRMTAGGRFPMLAAVMADETPEPDADTAFDLGLDYVLDGIANRHAPTSPMRYALYGATEDGEPAKPRTARRGARKA